jgi:hypothetical protein
MVWFMISINAVLAGLFTMPRSRASERVAVAQAGRVVVAESVAGSEAKMVAHLGLQCDRAILSDG